MLRSTQRTFSLWVLLAAGALLILLGHRGWLIDEQLPAQYFGVFLLALSLLGFTGVNVWWKGPLDPNQDADVSAGSFEMMPLGPGVRMARKIGFRIKTSGFSSHGTGVRIYGLRRGEPGRVIFTQWISLLWIPLVPLRTYSAIYVGQRGGNPYIEETSCFVQATRVRTNWSGQAATLSGALLTLVLAVAPSAAMIARTQGRAATKPEMVGVFASAIWAVALVIFYERRQRRVLRALSLQPIQTPAMATTDIIRS